MSSSEALRSLAEAVGLITGYQATTGEWVAPSDEDLLATLRLLGVDIASAGQAAALLADLDARRQAELMEPVLVAWDGTLAPVTVRLGVGVNPSVDAVTLSVRLESGVERFDVDWRDGLATLRRRLPLGRHELVVTEADGREHVAVIFAAPTVAWRPSAGAERRWGVFVPTYALRRGDDPSAIGDLADLEAAFDWLHGRGGQVVVTLPMLATFLDAPAEISPYSPVSRRFWNELFADLRVPAARAGIELGLPEGPLVDYAAAWAPRRAAIEQLAERMAGDRELDFFVAQHPLVEEYAHFRAAGARHGRDWRRWPTHRPGNLDPTEIRFHITAQWLMDRQLGRLQRKVAARGQLLALDLPLGSHPDGFDVWHEGELFVEGVSVGAPPDSFFTKGQDWGFPPVHPERSRRQGHRFLQDCIRHHVRHAGLLRVDHILGLLRLYWVRSGVGAAHGVYVRYPLEELLAVIALEASRAGAMVVGENLGTVPPEVTEAMGRHGVLGCAVSQFDVFDLLADGDRPVAVPPPATVATLNTHDTATFAGFWSGDDALDRADLGLLDADALAAELAQRAELRSRLLARLELPEDTDAVEGAAAVLGVAAGGDAALVVLNVEDGWAEPNPQNVPGTVSERPNWRRRVAVPIDEWSDHPGLNLLVDVVAEARPGWGRMPDDGLDRLAPDRS